MKQYAEDFKKEFIETFPKELEYKFILLECFSNSEYGDTIFAKEKSTDKFCVVKCFNKQFLKFNKMDFQLLQSLNHPGLPKIIGYYQNEQMECIVREYIEGKTLAELSLQKNFTEDEVLKIGMHLCDVLCYLHEQNPPVIHRDIKPENIVIKEDGSPILIDFGIARVYQEGAGADTVLCGTHDYAPPEQYGFMQTDCRSDIYSLGMVLNYVLKRKTKKIERIIQKSTAFSPEKRYQSAKKLKKELQAALSQNIKRKRKTFFFVRAGILVVLFSVLIIQFRQREKIVFQEPVIAKAVYTMLDKKAGTLTTEDLLSVTEIYIGKDVIYTSMDDFYSAPIEDASSRGEIRTLDDLSKMKNLEIVCIGQEQIKDISGLTNLENLDAVELRFNEIEDISALKDKQFVTKIGLNTNPLKDIGVLKTCPSLVCLDLRSTGDGYSAEGLTEMNQSFALLDVADAADAYQYLSGKNVNTLKVANERMIDLDCIKTVGTVYNLDISYSKIRDISALQGRKDIMSISMILCNIDDLSPLLSLPSLEKVTLSESMREKIEALGTDLPFSIEYIN